MELTHDATEYRAVVPADESHTTTDRQERIAA